jgi:hypothetical protein
MKKLIETAWEDYFFHREMYERSAALSVKKRNKQSMEAAAAKARYLDGLPKADIADKLRTIKAVESAGKYGHNGLGKEYAEMSLFRTVLNYQKCLQK